MIIAVFTEKTKSRDEDANVSHAQLKKLHKLTIFVFASWRSEFYFRRWLK